MREVLHGQMNHPRLRRQRSRSSCLHDIEWEEERRARSTVRCGQLPRGAQRAGHVRTASSALRRGTCSKWRAHVPGSRATYAASLGNAPPAVIAVVIRASTADTETAPAGGSSLRALFCYAYLGWKNTQKSRRLGRQPDSGESAPGDSAGQ